MLSGSGPVPAGRFLQASAAAEAILVEETYRHRAAPAGARPLCRSRYFTFALACSGSVHAIEGDAHAAAALLEPRPVGEASRSSSATSPATRCRLRR
jgi:hypothetical protein